MEILRTPDECFEELEDFPFPPNYTMVDGLRIHHVETKSAGEKNILLLHGELSWSFTFRKVIPIIHDENCRILAPDMAGFGRSDKPSRPEAYSASGHISLMRGWIKSLNLENIILVTNGLGTLIGLRLAALMPRRFDGILVTGGCLPAGEYPGIRFRTWDLVSRYSPFYPFGIMVQGGCRRILSSKERAGYDAPFPTSNHASVARNFSRMVPCHPADPEAGDNRRAWSILNSFEKPFITAFGDRDPFFKNSDILIRNKVPGAEGMKHRRLPAKHFVQEDAPELMAETISELINISR